jgi:gas vesicle protein
MSRRNSIATYALVGLAAGTIAYLLLGTKGGRKQLDCASREIQKFTDDIRKKSKKGYGKAAEWVDRASDEINVAGRRAKDAGKAFVNEAADQVHDAADRAKDRVQSATDKFKNS